MKKVKIFAMILMGMGLVCSCETDRDDNPVMKKVDPATQSFVLNTPAYAGATYDLDYSENVQLTCNAPSYGFPASTTYAVQVSLKSDMRDSTELNSTWPSTKIKIDGNELAVAITNLALEHLGKVEADFPINVPVYLRLRAFVDGVEGTELFSNIVTLKDCRTSFALPPVEVPEKVYICGGFNGWSWDKAVTTTQVWGQTNMMWRMIYIDEQGIKFNAAPAWDGNQKGYAELTSIGGDKASSIVKTDDGNIAASTPGWFLMVLTGTINGRNIDYSAEFYAPEVWLMGPVVGNSDWAELEAGWSCTVPDGPDGEFVSPAFAASVPGGDGDGVRAYVKIPGVDWWKSEFMIYDKKIAYRGAGEDQNKAAPDGFGYRVAGQAGQKLYLKFSDDTGRIE